MKRRKRRNVNRILTTLLLFVLLFSGMNAYAATPASGTAVIVNNNTDVEVTEEGIAIIAFHVTEFQSLVIQMADDSNSDGVADSAWVAAANWNNTYAENSMIVGRMELTSTYESIECTKGDVAGKNKYGVYWNVSTTANSTIRTGTVVLAMQAEVGDKGKVFRCIASNNTYTTSITSDVTKLLINDLELVSSTFTMEDVTAEAGDRYVLDLDNGTALTGHVEENIEEKQYNYDASMDTYTYTGTGNRTIDPVASSNFNPYMFFVTTDADGKITLSRSLTPDYEISTKTYGICIADNTKGTLTDNMVLPSDWEYAEFNVSWQDNTAPTVYLNAERTSSSSDSAVYSLKISIEENCEDDLSLSITSSTDAAVNVTDSFVNESVGKVFQKTYTVTTISNGLLTVKVTDSAGNEASATQAARIGSSLIPTNVHLMASDQSKLTTLTSGVEFYVAADDIENPTYYFYVDGVLAYSGENDTYTVTKNGKVTAGVLNDGTDTQIASEGYTLSKVDGTAPTISDVTLRGINDSYVLATVAATDNMTSTDNLSYRLVTYDTDYKLNSNGYSFNIYHSGTYTFAVTDEAGNTTTVEKVISLSAIVKSADTFIEDVTLTGIGKTYTYNSAVYAKDGIRITPVLTSEADLSKVSYSYDGGKTYSLESSKVVTENGTYKVYVKETLDDNSTMVHKTSVQVTGIDYRKPTVTVATNGSKAVIVAKDNLSGIGTIYVYKTDTYGNKQAQAYTYSGTQTVVTKPVYMDTTSAYSVKVIDNVGNTYAETTLRDAQDTEITEETRYVWAAFVDWDNTIIDMQKVLEGTDATAPANPTRDGYIFTGWNQPYTGLTRDVTYIRAQYVKETAKENAGNEKTYNLDYVGNTFLYSNAYSGFSALRGDVDTDEKTSLSSETITLNEDFGGNIATISQGTIIVNEEDKTNKTVSIVIGAGISVLILAITVLTIAIGKRKNG